MEPGTVAEQIKFQPNVKYEVKLAFDEPKIFTGGKYGDSVMYGGSMGTKDVRFYASAGLHEEIQTQKLKRGDVCKIEKITKAGEDYTIFTVNGVNHKHDVGPTDNYETLVPPQEIIMVAEPSELEARVKKLEDVVFKDVNDADIPY
tara:strand:+ start:1387 stop:1824 length:438 start_codon:yes stop_codon:yes gene_type:complete